MSKYVFVAVLCFSLLCSPMGVAIAATTLSFTVNMSENVTVDTGGGTPRVAIDVGGVTRYATYASGTGTSALVFTYAAVAGDIDLDGITTTSPIDLNGGTMRDAAGNDTTLTFTLPNTTNVRVNYPSLSMDFVDDADGRYTFNGTSYNTLAAFLTASGGTYTRGSVATYYDASGILQTAASGVPRFDHDPVTLARRGLLIEEARTNLILRSNAFTTAPWDIATCGGVADSGSTTIAPDGNTVPIYNFSTSACIFQDVTVTNGIPITHSVWIKANQAATLGFRTPGTGGTTSSPIAVGTTWQRYTLTATSSATTSRLLVDNRLANGYGTAGLQLSFFGAQAEESAFATSYVPTSATTVTRVSDILTVPTGAWYNQTAGTMFGDMAWLSAAGINYPMMMRFDDTTNANRWNFFFNQNIQRIGFDGYTTAVGQGSLHFGAVATSGAAKMAAAQALNDTNTSYAGTLGGVDVTWNPPPATIMTLKSNAASYKWVKTFKYYPVRISNAQLQLITQ